MRKKAANTSFYWFDSIVSDIGSRLSATVVVTPVYDCPAYPLIYECISLVAGASLAAADSILTGEADVAINWNGGWHHAKRWDWHH